MLSSYTRDSGGRLACVYGTRQKTL